MAAQPHQLFWDHEWWPVQCKTTLDGPAHDPSYPAESDDFFSVGILFALFLLSSSWLWAFNISLSFNHLQMSKCIFVNLILLYHHKRGLWMICHSCAKNNLKKVWYSPSKTEYWYWTLIYITIRKLTNKQRANVFKDTVYSKIKKSVIKKKNRIIFHSYSYI